MIQFVNVYKSYGPGITSLSDVSLTIKKGEFVFITGPSGSGKTTLLKLLYREERPTGGHILINGKDISTLRSSEIPYLRRRIGVVFQDFRLLYERTIFENVAIPLEVSGLPKDEVIKRVQGILKTVRLHHRMDERVSSLSGGEQQKVAVARAIINNPMTILADEPLGSLDRASGDEIMEILRSVNSRGTTVVFATHDLSAVGSGRAVVIEKGRVLS
jgi:cell division transport system ATP-binding protein